MRHLVICSALFIACLGACNKGGDHKPLSGSGSATAPAAPAGVALLVDGQSIATIADAQVAQWPRLDSLLPTADRRVGTWDSITVTGAKAPTELKRPSASHPDLIAALFPGEGGKAAFGMFDPVELAKHGAPKLREDNLREVRIALAKDSGRGENDHQGGEAVDPSKLQLTIKTPKGETVMSGAKLLETAREPEPGHDKEDVRGWTLSTVLAQAGITGYSKLVLADAAGTSLTLEKQDLDPKTSVPFIKLNKQGALRFRVFKKQGDTWQPGGDLRNLAFIEVVK